MLGLGLRSSQNAGATSAPPAPSFATLLSSDFNTDLTEAQLFQSGRIGGDQLLINPYSDGNAVVKAVLPAGWAQGYEAVSGTADPLVADDITSVGVWDTGLIDGVTSDIYPLLWVNGITNTPSNDTGADGPPVSRTDSTVDTSDSDDGRYLYTETSSNRGGHTSTVQPYRVFLLRTPGLNFSTDMADTSNVVRVEMQVHGFGGTVGEIQIWMDDASTSNTSSAVKVFDYDGFGQTDSSDPYEKITFEVSTIDLPGSGSIDVRTTNSDFYFYIVHDTNKDSDLSYTGDLAIDNFFIEEVS